jgi:hypothetical protein
MVPLGNVDSLTVPGHVQGDPSSDQSAPRRKANPPDPSPILSAPSISYREGSSDHTRPMRSQPLPPLSVSSGNRDNPPVLDRVRGSAKSSVHTPDPRTAFEDTSNQMFSASAPAKSILHGVGRSSGAYPPLKSVARCLGVILDNCEVRPLFHIFNPQ